jgi:hypothetical protein
MPLPPDFWTPDEEPKPTSIQTDWNYLDPMTMTLGDYAWRDAVRTMDLFNEQLKGGFPPGALSRLF